jgi:hypothetical protein
MAQGTSYASRSRDDPAETLPLPGLRRRAPRLAARGCGRRGLRGGGGLDAVRAREERLREAKSMGLWALGTVAALLSVYAWVEGFLTACWSGYAIAVVSGIPVTAAWPNLLYRLLDRYVPRRAKDFEAGEGAGHERIWWIAVLVGIFERTLITTLVAYDVSGVASFIAAWIAIKMASGWQKWSVGTQYARAAAFIALLGNVMSILFALLGGILCR